MKYKDCNQFVAIMDSDYLGFFLVDLKSWNKGDMPEEDYNEKIYEAIEALGGCSLESGNHFDLDEKFKDDKQLEEFLRPLSWIKVVDSFKTKVKSDYPKFEDEDENELE